MDALLQPECVAWPQPEGFQASTGQAVTLVLEGIPAGIGNDTLLLSGSVHGRLSTGQDGTASLMLGEDSINIVGSTATFALYAVLIFAMQPGFALLESGAARAQSVLMVAVKNAFDACVVALVWWLVRHETRWKLRAYHTSFPCTAGWLWTVVWQ